MVGFAGVCGGCPQFPQGLLLRLLLPLFLSYSWIGEILAGFGSKMTGSAGKLGLGWKGGAGPRGVKRVCAGGGGV